MSFRERLPGRLVVLSCGLLATGPALVVGVLVVRLSGLSGWPAVLVLGPLAGVLTFAAGVLSEPLVSRLQNLIERRVSADEHTR